MCIVMLWLNSIWIDIVILLFNSQNISRYLVLYSLKFMILNGLGEILV